MPLPNKIEIKTVFKRLILSFETIPNAIQLAMNAIETKIDRVISELFVENKKVKKYAMIINCINILLTAYKELPHSRFQERRIKTTIPTGINIIASCG
tara:strand:+ start:23 stop:316 length:294 start_codon:yes stop_codon:yes gene_type:complete